MRVTFPHIGNLWVALKALADRTGFDLVVPPLNSQRTLSLGVRYSPEMVCLPFKLTLGNFIEALELGADTILTIGQYGPCRFGYYNKVQEVILEELGYDFEMLKQSRGMVHNIKYMANGASLGEILLAFRFGIAKLKVLEEVEHVVHKIRAIERDRGKSTQIYMDTIKEVDAAKNLRAVKRVKRERIRELMTLPKVSSSEPLKIGLIGEFFVVVDHFANMNIEIELGKLGVEVRRPQSLLEWINLNPFAIIFGLQEKDRSHRAAMPYLGHHVGGDGWQSVGEKVLHARDWDGLVHVEPFGCLPETMARNIMPSTKERIPVLNIAFDEHTGKAGMINRLEAFVDMISRRKAGGAKLCV
jgi:predicted nucleotide-binding protein (sugar kinase/HSP70/actin superfamily)